MSGSAGFEAALGFAVALDDGLGDADGVGDAGVVADGVWLGVTGDVDGADDAGAAASPLDPELHAATAMSTETAAMTTGRVATDSPRP